MTGYADHYTTEWYNASNSLPYAKTVKMEPVTSYCYTNETALPTMPAQTVYPSGHSSIITMDPYHYASYSATAIPSSQYCTQVDSYSTHSTSPINSWSPAAPQSSQYSVYHGQAHSNTSPVPSEEGACNPLTPPHSQGIPSSPQSGYHEDSTMIHHSPSSSPASISETSYQTVSMHRNTHLPESPLSDSRSPVKDSVPSLLGK